jgi:hypothetical protein
MVLKVWENDCLTCVFAEYVKTPPDNCPRFEIDDSPHCLGYKDKYLKKKEEEIDCEYTTHITCPYCGWFDRDSWEVDFGGMEGETEYDCGECEKEFTVCRQVEITYSSYKKEKENESK